MRDNQDHADGVSFSGWRVAAMVFVILNVSLGVNFATYGLRVSEIEREFTATRALASAGLSMLTLSLGLLSPFVGTLMRRYSLRALMCFGIVLNAAGYLLLSQQHDIGALLAIYGLMIGPGFCMSAVIPCTAIIGNWFVRDRGKALGIVNMPIGNTVMPLVAAFALPRLGLATTHLMLACLLLLILPLVLLVPVHPEDRNERALGAGPDPSPGLEESDASLSARAILTSPAFIILTLGVSILSAGGMVMVTQLVSLATGRGVDLAQASGLVAAFGLAGIAGAPLFGMVSDRIGGRLTFAILAFVLILPWLGLAAAGSNFALLLVSASLIGAISGAILPLFGSTMSDWLGTANVGLGMGLCYALQIPFLFGAPPLAGAMFDATGSYFATIILHCITFAAVGALFLIYRPRRAGR